MTPFTTTTHEAATIARAGMGGTVTIVRRLKPVTCLNGGLPMNNGRGEYATANGWTKFPLSPGKPVWVKEGWASNGLNWGKPIREMRRGLGPIHYAASDAGEWKPYWGPMFPAITMPKFAARFTLTPEAVRVCRVIDMSVDEVIAADCAAWERNDWVMVALCKIGGVE